MSNVDLDEAMKAKADYQVALADMTERTHALEKQRDALLTAAVDVVSRWHSPKWKDLPHTGTYIQALEDAIACVKGSQDAMIEAIKK